MTGRTLQRIGNQKIVRLIFFFSLSLLILSGCNPAASIELPLPTTASPANRMDLQPSSRQNDLTAARILTDFPLSLGAAWTYSAEISYMDPEDHQQTTSWTGTITDTVVTRSTGEDGQIIFTIQEDLNPVPPRGVWRELRRFDYIVTADGLYEGKAKIIEWPLDDNKTWKVFADFNYRSYMKHAGDVSVPYGELNNCYLITLPTNPDISSNTFCPGVGIVQHDYIHHGTPQAENLELISFTPGESSVPDDLR